MSSDLTTHVPGERLIIRDEEWLVQRVDTTSSGEQALSVTGLSPLVQGQERIFLTSLEERIEVLDPCNTLFVQDGSPNYRQSRLYLECLLRQTPPTDGDLYIGHRAAIDLVPYQLDPAFRALQEPRPRILMADAVGLGKTIECGILLAELIRRGRGKRIMVLTMKSMLTQFQKELWARFSIPLVRLDSIGIQRVRNRIPANENPFYYYDRTIISIDTLKQESEYRVFLEDPEVHWDIIVIDEAHNVAVRGSQSMRAKLARLLADKSDALIMLSATPHDGRRQSFASLMAMLNPTAIADPEHYRPEDIRGLFIRRFKKDIRNQVADKFLERLIGKEQVDASPQEEAAYNLLADLQLDSEAHHRNGSLLFKTTLEKALFSSPAACRETLRNRLRTLQERGGHDADIDQLQRLDQTLDALMSPADTSSKYQRLLQMLKPRTGSLHWNPNAPDDRVVVFTERIETMRLLERHLPADLGLKPSQVAIMYGGIPDVELQRTVEDFGNASSRLRLLICSDVAAEGINLHYQCHRLIHFDIPWSLIVFQQRNGRVDRYGQTQRPEIHYLCIHSQNQKIHGDNRILELLIDKDREVQDSIGDPSEFTRCNSPEEEEAAVANAMETNTSPDDFANSFGNLDDFDQIFNGDGDGDNHGDAAPAGDGHDSAADHCRAMPTLFPSDFTYASEALAFLHGQTNGQLQYETMPAPPGGTGNTLLVTPTPDLALILKSMPPEVLPSQGQFVLCDDRQRLQDELRRCRDSADAWPAVQLLWEQHPLMEYLNAKVLASFARQHAPVIELPDCLQPGERVFAVSAVIPNRLGQPLIYAWYGVLCRDAAVVDLKPLADWIEPLRLNQPSHPNPLRQPDTDALRRLLPEVIRRVRAAVSQERDDFEQRNFAKHEAHLQALEDLRRRHEQQLAAQFDALTPSERAQNRHARRQRELKQLFDDYFTWIRDAMLTEDQPHIQIACAFQGGN
ncbi:MAG: helicase-related protein [Oligosphaeraceae bacterium]